MKASTIANTFTLAAITAFALGIAPRANADDRGCSEATLNGTFAYTSTGIILTAPIPALIGPSAEVGTQYFDGEGNVTFTFNASQNGAIGPGTAKGTYTVNDDCTGTFKEIIDGFPAHFSIVIDKGGDEFQGICQDSGVVATRIGRRQFPRDDWRR
jgi:hypothetical protein